jgi:phosphoglycerol transferase MdoB-like AlkP superfamily enzyme
MQLKLEQPHEMKFYQTVWFMWICLIFIPPIGIFLMWKYRKISKGNKIIATILAVVYFVGWINIATGATPSLFINQDKFVDAFQDQLKEANLPYSLKNQKRDQHTIISKLDDDITLVENLDETGRVCELVMVGQGEGRDIVPVMGLLIRTVDKNMDKEDTVQVLKELRLFDESYSFHKNETTVEKNNIRYNLKYDQDAGVIFSISSALD